MLFELQNPLCKEKERVCSSKGKGASKPSNAHRIHKGSFQSDSRNNLQDNQNHAGNINQSDKYLLGLIVMSTDEPMDLCYSLAPSLLCAYSLSHRGQGSVYFLFLLIVNGWFLMVHFGLISPIRITPEWSLGQYFSLSTLCIPTAVSLSLLLHFLSPTLCPIS